MVVKVYGMARAVCPQRVLACLLEKGVEFELVHVDLDKGEQKDPNFLLLQVRVLAYTHMHTKCVLSESIKGGKGLILILQDMDNQDYFYFNLILTIYLYTIV